MQNRPRLDRTDLRVISLEEEGDDRAFWATKTPAERLDSLEYLRRATYGQKSCEAGMIKVIRTIDCPWSNT